MKKWIPVGLVFFLAVFAIWFWSLGRLPADQDASAHILTVQGRVEYQEPGQEAWQAATNGQGINKGSSLRTSASSTATIDWYGQGQTHIGENSTIHIDDLNHQATGSLMLTIKLEQGRLWSRLRRLIDLDSHVQTETSDIIATVRGTAFDLEKTAANQETTLWVSDSVVQAQSVQRKNLTVFVPQGEMVKLSSKLAPTSSQDITPTGKASAWFIENRDADKQFFTNVRDSLKQQALAKRPALGGLGEWLQDQSFALHLAWAGKDQQVMARRLFELRLLSIRHLFDEGKSGSAIQQFNDLERELKNKDAAKGPVKILSKQDLTAIIKQVLPAFDELSPDSSVFRLKQRLEDSLLELSDSQTERAFHRLFGIAERLDEASESLEQSNTLQAIGLIDIAKKALDNFTRESKDLQKDTQEDWSEINQIQKALSVRLAAIQKDIEDVTRPTLPPVLSDPELTSSTSTQATTTTDLTNQPCQNLRFTVPALSLNVGSSTTLKTEVTFQNVSEDVTSDTQFSLTGDGAALRSNQLVGLKPGRGEVTASYTCEGQAMTSKATFQVQSPNPVDPIVVGLDIIANPPRILTLGKSTIQVMARFQDGSRKDVTREAKLRLSDIKVGQLNGMTFEAYQVSGQTSIMAEYVSGQKTWTAETTITITNPDIPATRGQ